MTTAGFMGGALQSFNHGIESPLLFGIVGVVYERLHHRNLNDMGGLAQPMPHYAALATIGLFAALGLPGLNMFIGEALSLLGAFVPESMLVLGTKAAPGLGARWIVGSGFAERMLKHTDHPKPGDLVIFTAKWHHAIVVSADGPELETIDGNQRPGTERKFRKRGPDGRVAGTYAYYSIDQWIERLWAARVALEPVS